jgi:hypothetical protein
MITIYPNKGFAKATNFNLTLSDTVLSSYDSFLWDFGDGNTSRNKAPNYSYIYPGNFTVTVKAYNKKTGENTIFSSDLNVGLYLSESIYFDVIPPPTFSGYYNKYPFKVNITSSQEGKHIIDLSTQFSKSYEKQNPENKWSFLRPEWKFLDLNGNKIDYVETKDTPIKIDNFGNLDTNGTTVGITGTAEFYLVDDNFNSDLVVNNKPYTTIIATLRTDNIKSFHDSFNANEELPSYSNSLAVAVAPYMILWKTPEKLEITENGTKGFSNIKWSSSKNPILIKISNNSIDQNSKEEGNYFKVYKEDSYICHDIPFSNDKFYTLNILLCGISGNITPSNYNINYIDETLYKTQGYFKGTISTQKVSAQNVKIKTNVYITDIPELSGNLHNPLIWISNPNAGMMAVAQYYYFNELNQITDKNLNKANFKSFDLPTQRSLNETYPLTGYHGIYSVAALPAPTFNAWVADAELNSIYKISSIGSILCSININEILNKNNLKGLVLRDQNYYQTTPSSITLDSNQNLWVTLYDTISCLKFNSNGEFLFATSPISNLNYNISGGNVNFYNLFLQNCNYYALSTNEFDFNLLEPTCIETDCNDNAWVSYSNLLSGFVIKYNQNGILQNIISYPINFSPNQIKCDAYNNIWITCSQTIEKRNSNGLLLSSFGIYDQINNLCLDRNQNPWFTYSYQWVGSIDTKNGDLKNIKMFNGTYSEYPQTWMSTSSSLSGLIFDENMLEGIASDSLGRVFVINSIENKIYVLDSNTNTIIDYFYIGPKGYNFTIENNEEYNINTQIDFDLWSKSAQAQGDWTGFNWINKYGKNKLNFIYPNSSVIFLSGETDYINFYYKNPYEFFKINENFDMSENMRSVTFQKILNESDFLFDDFLGSIFGKFPFEHDDLGVNTYEKISNFNINHSDIDTCNIDLLYDSSNMLDLDNTDFKIEYPNQIKKLMDILSINKSRLWGTKLNDKYNFIKYNKNNNFNRGDLISLTSYKIKADDKVILRTKSLNDFRLINTGYLFNSNFPITSSLNIGTSTYTINELATSLNLGIDWYRFYEFYKFKDQGNDIITDSIIDWNNEQTVLNKNLSSNEYWIGENGVVENIFSYYLYKGFDLI